MLVHGVYKSYMFIISGTLIHVNNNFQSIYMIRRVSIMIHISIIMVCVVLIGALSKEAIIVSSSCSLVWCWIGSVFRIGGVLTTMYSMVVCVGVWVGGVCMWVVGSVFMMVVYGIVGVCVEWVVR